MRIRSRLFLGFLNRTTGNMYVSSVQSVCNVLCSGTDRTDNARVRLIEIQRQSCSQQKPSSGSITRYRSTVLLACDVWPVKNWLFVENLRSIRIRMPYICRNTALWRPNFPIPFRFCPVAHSPFIFRMNEIANFIRSHIALHRLTAHRRSHANDMPPT